MKVVCVFLFIALAFANAQDEPVPDPTDPVPDPTDPQPEPEPAPTDPKPEPTDPKPEPTGKITHLYSS